MEYLFKSSYNILEPIIDYPIITNDPMLDVVFRNNNQTADVDIFDYLEATSTQNSITDTTNTMIDKSKKNKYLELKNKYLIDNVSKPVKSILPDELPKPLDPELVNLKPVKSILPTEPDKQDAKADYIKLKEMTKQEQVKDEKKEEVKEESRIISKEYAKELSNSKENKNYLQNVKQAKKEEEKEKEVIDIKFDINFKRNLPIDNSVISGKNIHMLLVNKQLLRGKKLMLVKNNNGEYEIPSLMRIGEEQTDYECFVELFSKYGTYDSKQVLKMFTGDVTYSSKDKKNDVIFYVEYDKVLDKSGAIYVSINDLKDFINGKKIKDVNKMTEDTKNILRKIYVSNVFNTDDLSKPNIMLKKTTKTIVSRGIAPDKSLTTDKTLTTSDKCLTTDKTLTTDKSLKTSTSDKTVMYPFDDAKDKEIDNKLKGSIGNAYIVFIKDNKILFVKDKKEQLLMLPGSEKEIVDTTSFRCAMRGFKEQTGFNIEKKDVLSIVHHVYNNPDLNSNTVLYIIKSKQTFPTYDATKTNGEIDAVEYVPIKTVKEFRKNIKEIINKYLLEIQKASLI